MTKQEKILRQQIKDLERLLEIKEEVIKELKSLIRPWNTWATTGTITSTPCIDSTELHWPDGTTSVAKTETL